MFDVILVLLRSLISGCQSRRLLLLENLTLRHQLMVLRRQARQPKLRQADRLLWLTLRRLTDYLSYYHQHRTHRSLDEDSPESRAVEPPAQGNIIALPLVNGLHHRYTRQAAA